VGGAREPGAVSNGRGGIRTPDRVLSPITV
jgi:hypothetical protein